MKELKVLPHAIEQARSRMKIAARRPDSWVAEKLREMVRTGGEWVLKPQKRLTQLLAHGCEDARYFKKDGMLVVVAGDTIKTVHGATHVGKWTPKKPAQ